ncbi:MAG: fimbrillin family protein [Bacteroidales bacterium]|nr:fimbrillin family protein [Bacteroidales bacterium]
MMKNIRYIALPALLAVAFSCSKEQDILTGPGEIIKFDAGTAETQTKASTDFPTTSSFGVSAFHTQESNSYSYFNNVQVSYASDKWASAVTLYWPKAASGDGTSLEFRGYAPYNASSPWCTFPDNVSFSGAYVLTPAESSDLMYSAPKAINCATPSTVGLTFSHALGQTTFSFTCERFDDSIEKGKMTVFGQEIEIYCKYTENDSTKPVEEKSFVFLSGNYPSGYSAPDEYEPGVQAFDLKNPIQNIWYVEVTGLRVDNLAWSGELEMTTDGTSWTKPANNAWTSLGNRQSLTLLSESDDPFYFSPNTKGFAMPFGTYTIIPQDLQPVLSSQKPVVSIDLNFLLFRAEDNAANDSASAGDVRSRIFDYRDIGQYVDADGNLVDGNTRKSGVFKKWYHENKHRTFPNGTSLDFGVAVPRADATPTLTISKTVTLPLYDSKTSNPRYLQMNTNTTYSVKVDPAGDELTFSPSIDSWVNQSAEEN